MSHNITSTDNVFAVRDPMWHALGNVVMDTPSRDEAFALAFTRRDRDGEPVEALPGQSPGWNPISEPLFRRVVTVEAGGPVESFEEVDDAKAVVRDDNGALIGTASKGVAENLVSNDDLFDIAEAIQGEGEDVQYETGGSLLGGRKVFLTLRLNDPIQIKGDPNGTTLPRFALQNSNDGSGAFRGQGLETRIVCDNTSRWADMEAQNQGTEFVFRHTSSIRERIDQATAALAGWREDVARYQRFCEHLIGLPVTKKQRELFVTEFVPMPVTKESVSDTVVRNIEEARAAVRDILASRTCEGINSNAYGLVQAAVEYQQHVRRAASVESRFKRAVLDSDRFLVKDVALVRSIVNDPTLDESDMVLVRR